MEKQTKMVNRITAQIQNRGLVMKCDSFFI
jgi:hypothetical protein